MAQSALVVPYLMLVSFLTPVLSHTDISKVRALNDSPFHGLAAMVRCAYSTEKVNERDFVGSVRTIKMSSKKDVWPWVFFNRFIGYKDGDEADPAVRGTELSEPFRQIRGMDLYNEAGALNDFYNTWQISLRLAKRLKAPGIVVDAEPYNNYITSDLLYLAQLIGRPTQEVRQRLQDIGAVLTDMARETYPEATIWILSTQLGYYPNPRTLVGKLSPEKCYSPATYIIMGMLERAKITQSKLKFISGGQEGLGYCHHTLEAMQTKIRARERRFKPILRSYENLQLAGTIALWDTVESKSGYFVTNSECNNSSAKTIEEFEPFLKELFARYPYNWIYASSWWNPYDRTVSAAYEKTLERALRPVRSAKQEH